MTTTAAIKIDINTESGTACYIGIKNDNMGTAIKDSPNPNVERTRVAMKMMNRI